MAFKKKIKDTLKKAKVLVVKNNFASPTKDFFIYQVIPTSDEAKLKMKRHPRYKTYSVFTSTELSINSEVTVDMDVIEKNGDDTYEVTNIHIEYPTTPQAQWDYLDKVTKDKKTVLYALQEVYKNNTLILDIVTSSFKEVEAAVVKHYENNGASVKKVDTAKRQLFELNEYLARNKATSMFMSALPEEVAELLTTSESEKLSKLVEGNPTASAEKWLKEPWLALTLEGFGFLTVDKIRARLAEIYPENESYNVKSIKRIAYGAFYVADREIISQGHTWLDTKEFKDVMISDLGIDEVSYTKFMEFDRFNREVTQLLGKSSIKVEDDMVTTQLLWDSENRIFQELTKTSIMEAPREFETKLAAFKKNLKERGQDLTSEQLSVFESIGYNKFTMLVGPGGTGKTWTVAKLVEFVKTKLKWEVLLAAPTGKAATVLTTYVKENSQFNLKTEAKTLHSAFGIVGDKAATRSVDEPQLILIDEFSMTDSVLMSQVLQGLKNNKDYRIIFVGDEFQLPSVGPGNLLHLFINKFQDKINTIKLTKVFRTKEGGITDLATNLRKGKFPYPSNDNLPYSSGNDLVLQNCSSQAKIRERVLTAYSKLLEQGESPLDIMVLTPKNKGLTGQVELNSDIQSIIREYYNLDNEEEHLTYKLYGKEINLYSGDMIMFLHNQVYPQVSDFDTARDYQNVDKLKFESIANGEVGMIIALDESLGLLVELPGHDAIVFVPRESLSELNLGYSYTIHKSQGSQARFGILALDSSDTFMLNANLMYTAVSRFQERLYFFANWKTVNTKVKSFINQSRRTLLEVWKNEDDVFF